MTSRDRVTQRVVVVGSVIALLMAASAQLVRPDTMRPAVRSVWFLSHLAYGLLWTALATLVIQLVNRMPIVKPNRRRALLFHLAAGIAIGVLHFALFAMVTAALFSWLPDKYSAGAAVASPPPLLTRLRMMIELEFTMYWAIAGLAHALRFHQESEARAIASARLRTELAEARLRVLQQQMKPHFLFNALHGISILMRDNVDAAEEMIDRLGQLLRMAMRSDHGALVPLEWEVQFTELYASVEQLNHGARLSIVWDVPPETLSCAVPGPLLQPLVENAVQHAVFPNRKGGTIRISARLESTRLTLTVADTGPGEGRRRPAGAGMALENLRARLGLTYGPKYDFHMGSNADGGVTVKISVPASIAQTGAVELRSLA